MKKIQLSIPTPCHENWENMTLVEKGKFCNSCQKKVIDFSLMTDREIAQFFKRPSIGTVCGRFMDDQLNRDIEIPRKRIPWVKYFFQFTLPAFMISMKTSGQKVKPLMGKVAPVCVSSLIGDTIVQIKRKDVTGGLVIKGRTTDSSGNPIPYSSISIKGTNIAAQSNAEGKFVLNVKQEMNTVSIVASAVGYESKEMSLDPKDYTNDSVNVILPLYEATLGEVVITSAVAGRVGRVGLVGAVSTITVYDQVKNWLLPTKHYFTIFPNPAQKATAVNIKLKKFETGYFTLQLFNLAGQLLFSKEMPVEEKNEVLNFKLPNVASGNYVVRMTNRKTGKAYSEKIIIQ